MRRAVVVAASLCLVVAVIVAACGKPAPPPPTEAQKRVIDKSKLQMFAPLPPLRSRGPRAPPPRRWWFSDGCSSTSPGSPGSQEESPAIPAMTWRSTALTASRPPTATRVSLGDRNSPTVFNAAAHFTQFWDGTAPGCRGASEGPRPQPRGDGDVVRARGRRGARVDARVASGPVQEGVSQRQDTRQLRQHGPGDRGLRAPG